MPPRGAYMTDRDRREIDILDWIDWGLFMADIEQHRSNPFVEWNRDMSFNEIAEMIGTDPPLLAPGDVLPDELGTAQLYWPAPPSCVGSCS